VATTPTASYQNMGLSPSTAYTYTVAAYDASGNTSAQSVSITSATVTPLPGVVPPPYPTPATPPPSTTPPPSYTYPTPATTPLSTSSSKFKTGNKVKTTAKLNVRNKPSIDAPIDGVQPLGSQGTIFDGPVTAPGFTWYRINYDTGPDGWSVQDSLMLASASTSPPPTSPPPSSTSPSSSSSLTPSERAQKIADLTKLIQDFLKLVLQLQAQLNLMNGR
jgi:hypothetical protein